KLQKTTFDPILKTLTVYCNGVPIVLLSHHIKIRIIMLMYGKEASNRKQEIDRQHYTIPNQRPKDKHFEKI
ncbi:MAG: hypothetical protein UHS47_06515, partial [Oscillospiraceae bacterium]|nr:hypothetical protein [Oscillospiraceae bacterium]